MLESKRLLELAVTAEARRKNMYEYICIDMYGYTIFAHLLRWQEQYIWYSRLKLALMGTLRISLRVGISPKYKEININWTLDMA